jgi:hypothetical protein
MRAAGWRYVGLLKIVVNFEDKIKNTASEFLIFPKQMP